MLQSVVCATRGKVLFCTKQQPLGDWAVGGGGGYRAPTHIWAPILTNTVLLTVAGNLLGRLVRVVFFPKRKDHIRLACTPQCISRCCDNALKCCDAGSRPAQPSTTQASESTNLVHEWRLLSRSAKIFSAKAAVIASIGGLLFGYDIGVVEGALPQLRDEMDLTLGQQDMVVAIMGAGAIAGTLV